MGGLYRVSLANRVSSPALIIVTGTRRAGTSMWMQVLAAAGYSVIGEPFPGDWATSLRVANPHGFYESLLRHGVYYRTNPHPVTGEYVRAEESTRHAVKVFIPGVLRSERAYLDHVLVSVRPWRAYVRSIRRLYALDDAAMKRAGDHQPPPPRMPPALEWWSENYALIRDIAVRRYACHVQSYGGVLRDPRGVVARTLAWLGGGGDVEAAIAAVKPATRTQRGDPSRDAGEQDVGAEGSWRLTDDQVRVFDAFYDAVDRGAGLEQQLIDAMNQVHQQLTPAIHEHQERILAFHHQRGARADDSPFAILRGEWA